jgi:choice-of-anchor A domain-containing protein
MRKLVVGRTFASFLIIATGVVGLCWLSPSDSSAATPISLGAAADYAVLGIGGSSNANTSLFSVYQSDTVIDGNVGMGPYSTWGHGIDATINGRVDYDLTDSAPIVTGNISGGVHQTSMSAPVNDAIAASNSYALLTPTQTFSTLQENQIIVGTGGLDVIRITNPIALKKGLTLEGSASDVFVFQITTGVTGHALTFSGMTMTLLGGVSPNNIVWSLAGKGGDVVINAGAVVYGTFLAPYRSITVDHGNITGRVIGGGGGAFVKIHSGSHIQVSPTTNP